MTSFLMGASGKDAYGLIELGHLEIPVAPPIFKSNQLLSKDSLDWQKSRDGRNSANHVKFAKGIVRYIVTKSLVQIMVNLWYLDENFSFPTLLLNSSKFIIGV